MGETGDGPDGSKPQKIFFEDPHSQGLPKNFEEGTPIRKKAFKGVQVTKGMKPISDLNKTTAYSYEHRKEGEECVPPEKETKNPHKKGRDEETERQHQKRRVWYRRKKGQGK